MKIAVLIARILLGLAFLVFGINGFFTFIEPPPMEGDAQQFVNILLSSGYLYVVKILEVAGGLMLLSGRFVPLGLCLLCPVIVNILLFHAFLEPSGLPMAVVLCLLAGFLVHAHRPSFAALFKARPT